MKLTKDELLQMARIVGETKGRSFVFANVNASACGYCGSQCKAGCSK